MTEKRNDLLVWIDLETTGLDQDQQMRGLHNHKILEIGLHITDSAFNIIDKGLSLVIQHNLEDIEPLMNDYVKNFHTKNGLLDRVQHSSMNLQQAEQALITYFHSYHIEPQSTPICGNNVSFDKNFLLAQLPEFSALLHYRKIDVSSFKEVFNRIYPENKDVFVKNGSHRALDDIKESIEELKYYNSFFFQKEPALTSHNKNGL